MKITIKYDLTHFNFMNEALSESGLTAMNPYIISWYQNEIIQPPDCSISTHITT